MNSARASRPGAPNGGNAARRQASAAEDHEDGRFIVEERYEIDGVLGQGGMGVVLGATDRKTGESLALKVLRSDRRHCNEALARFRQEGTATQRIKSPHVARVLDLGALGDGRPYIALERIDGLNLEQTLQQRGTLSLPEAIALALGACSAVGAAHAVGVLHRDVKPANLMLSSAGCKLIDFGISRFFDDNASPSNRLTLQSSCLGSPQYMSPEQLRDPLSVDERTDLWSLAVVLYEVVTGRAPFTGAGLTQLTCAVLLDDPLPPTAIDAKLPRALDFVLARALDKDRDKRFASASELGEALSTVPLDGRTTRCVKREATLGAGARPEQEPPTRRGWLHPQPQP